VEPDSAEIRVLGCLLEKQRTTPDVYPLTLNALRLACNQATNREPIVDYDDATIREALTHLVRRRWVRLASGSRAAKYRHLLDDALGLGAPEQAVLALLMLRGRQTSGELKQRSERLYDFADTAALDATLEGLMHRELVSRLPRRPGQKEQRYEQLLGGSSGEPEAPEEEREQLHVSAPAPIDDVLIARVELSTRVEHLEREVADLRADVTALRAEMAALREELGG
jgi:uncharacterized protein YceH (UPF0502 family)